MAVYRLSDERVMNFFWEIALACKFIKMRLLDSIESKVDLIIKHPSSFVWMRAREIYAKSLEDLCSDGIRTRDQMEKDIIDREFPLSDSDQLKLDQLDAQIDVLATQIERLRGNASMTMLRLEKERELSELNTSKYSILAGRTDFYLNTAEYRALIARNHYLVPHCLYYYRDGNIGNRVYTEESWNAVQADFSKKQILSEISLFLQGISAKDLRCLSRHSYVKVRWRISRKTGTPLFGIPFTPEQLGLLTGGETMFADRVSEWTQDQVSLAGWLLYYDDVAQGVEVPESLYDDDERFDEYVQKELEAKRSKRGKASTSDAHSHDEVIVFDKHEKEKYFADGDPNLYDPAAKPGTVQYRTSPVQRGK